MFKLEAKCSSTQYAYLVYYSVAVVIALLLVSETRGQYDSDRPTLLNLYEKALVNNSESLYTLRTIYFNPLPYKYSSSFCLQVSVTITVDGIRNPSNDCGAAFTRYSYDPDDSSYFFRAHCLLQLLHDEGGASKLSDFLSFSYSADTFYLFDPTFYTIMRALAKSIKTVDFDDFEYPDDEYDIEIDISGELEDMPIWDDAAYALRMLLVWAKSYARAGGIPLVRQEEDRIIVQACYNDSTPYYYNGCPAYQDTGPIAPSLTCVLFVCIFVSSYILVLSLVSLSIHKVFLWLQQQGKQTKLIYKASAIVLTFVNVITSGLDFSFRSQSFDWALQLMSVLPLKILLLLLIELPIVFFSTYELNQNGKKKYRPLHALALWQIVCFVHRFVIDIIISVVFFILAPAQTIGVVTLLLSVIASAIAFVAIIINRGCAGCTITFAYCAVFNGILITGLLITITLVFIVLVDNGLQAAGMGGLILSLIPPLAVFVIGIFVNKKHARSILISTFLGCENTSTNNSANSEADNGERQPLLAPRPGH